MDHYLLEKFVTYGATDLDYDSDYSDDSDDSDDVSNRTIDLAVPTTYSGYLYFEVEAQDELSQTIIMNDSGHVILNFIRNLLTRHCHQLKPSSIHNYFCKGRLPHILVNPSPFCIQRK